MSSKKSEFHFDGEPALFSGKELQPLLAHCVKHNASDITIQSGEQIMVEIYGRLHRITNRRMGAADMKEILSFLYQSESGGAKLNSGEDLPFGYEFRMGRDVRLRFRVNATAVSVEGHTGMEITLRTIPSSPPELKTMGVEQAIVDNFAPKQGLILITGATGSGKSTLLASGLRWLLENPNGNRKVLTYEAPIEFVYDDVEKPTSLISQCEIGRHLKTFADGVRNALRRKPAVILVGEARDAETIGECVTASMTGHLTYSTVHSNGVADTIRRMVNVFPPGEKHARAIDIISSLKMIVSQMLLPSTDGKRVALREYLVFNEEIVDKLINAGVENLTLATKNVLEAHGQSFLMDATNKHNDKRIDDYQFRRIKALTQGMERDAQETAAGGEREDTPESRRAARSVIFTGDDAPVAPAGAPVVEMAGRASKTEEEKHKAPNAPAERTETGHSEAAQESDPAGRAEKDKEEKENVRPKSAPWSARTSGAAGAKPAGPAAAPAAGGWRKKNALHDSDKDGKDKKH